METINQWRSSFGRGHHARHSTGSQGLNTSRDSNNNRHSANVSSSSSSNVSSSSINNDTVHKKRASCCDICGKRLLKLVKWRNYLTLPCRLKHVFCKQCITERLQCRQKVLGSVSFDLMWTFPCPGSAQCGQELTVDWSRGQSYSRNLVARDLASRRDESLASGDESWELEEEEEEEEGEGVDSSMETMMEESEEEEDERGVCHHDRVVREMG